MKNKKTFWSMLLAFVLLIGGAYVSYDRLGQSVETQQMIAHAETEPTESPAAEESPSEQPPQIVHAPDFTVFDANGSEVTLSQYFGKPIVLNFWASWCGPCQSEMPDFNEKYQELGEDVHFVMVNMTGGRETVETAQRFIGKNGYEFPILFDTRADAAMTYGAYSLPMTFFINAQGHVIARANGPINAETLQAGVDMIAK